MARYLAERPARFFGLWPRKGMLREGSDADILVLAPDSFRFDQACTHDGLNWSPYHGMEFAGRVAATFVRGRPVFDGRTVTGAPGHGMFVPRLPSET